MNYVLDTNILIYYLKKHEIANFIESQYSPLTSPNIAIISIVSIGELKSLAIQINWGDKKIKTLLNLLNQFIIVDVSSNELVNKYAEIDAFSQGKLKSKPLEMSARNMQKNDLWIAATASITNSTLISSDKDFSHLHNQFLNFININVEEIKNSLS